jgi:hypothetical protein
MSCNCWNHRRGPVLHIALWPQNWSAPTQGHRTLFAEVLPFWDSRGKCCERQVRLSRLEGRRGHDWALYWQLFETLNYAPCNGMRLLPRRCLRTVKLVHSLWKTWYTCSKKASLSSKSQRSATTWDSKPMQPTAIYRSDNGTHFCLSRRTWDWRRA